MLRYAVEFGVNYGTGITVVVDARNEVDAIRKASNEKVLKVQIGHLLERWIANYGISMSKFSTRKLERRRINGIIRNPKNIIRKSVLRITKMKEV